MRDTTKKRLRRAAVAGALAALLGLFVGFGPPQLMAKTSTPQFCGDTCHVMAPEFEAWQHSGPHSKIECVDCHLPNGDAISHYVWKGIDGMRDLVDFNTNRIPDPIRLSAHGQSVVKENCLRCHGEMVSRIHTLDRQCWECHRGVRHRLTGVRVGSTAAGPGSRVKGEHS